MSPVWLRQYRVRVRVRPYVPCVAQVRQAVWLCGWYSQAFNLTLIQTLPLIGYGAVLAVNGVNYKGRGSYRG